MLRIGSNGYAHRITTTLMAGGMFDVHNATGNGRNLIMTKSRAIELIDSHKNRLIDPVEMLDWSWLRVILNQIPDDEWDKATTSAIVILSR